MDYDTLEQSLHSSAITVALMALLGGVAGAPIMKLSARQVSFWRHFEVAFTSYAGVGAVMTALNLAVITAFAAAEDIGPPVLWAVASWGVAFKILGLGGVGAVISWRMARAGVKPCLIGSGIGARAVYAFLALIVLLIGALAALIGPGS